jgi:hypothetical protein
LNNLLVNKIETKLKKLLDLSSPYISQSTRMHLIRVQKDFEANPESALSRLKFLFLVGADPRDEQRKSFLDEINAKFLELQTNSSNKPSYIQKELEVTKKDIVKVYHDLKKAFHDLSI